MEREFQRVGFATCCKYARWLGDVQSLRDDLRKKETDLLPYFDSEYRWLSMGLSYLVQAGTDYATHAGRETNFTRDIELNLKKLLALKAPDF